ncbi:MAG: YbaB/EbfC family nucleoid-associated protein [Patescibacteria group bacterium]
MMNPFKMLGDMNEMRKQAGTIQKALEEQVFDVGFGSVKIKITGNQNVLSVTENGIERNDVRTAINDAIKKSQQAAAGKLMELSKSMGQGQ